MKITPNRKWPVSFVFLIITMGSILGTILSQIVAKAVPEGVVREFFLTSRPIGWDPFTLNLQTITFTSGFTIDISVASIIGMAVAWYFLRYFK